MIIGTFTYNPDTDTYSGVLATLTFSCDAISITPNEPSPELDFDYFISAETLQGRVSIGHGWNAALPNGRPYLSVHIDDPAFAAPIDAALWRFQHGIVAKLQWPRNKRRLFDFVERIRWKLHR